MNSEKEILNRSSLREKLNFIKQQKSNFFSLGFLLTQNFILASSLQDLDFYSAWTFAFSRTYTRTFTYIWTLHTPEILLRLLFTPGLLLVTFAHSRTCTFIHSSSTRTFALSSSSWTFAHTRTYNRLQSF